MKRLLIITMHDGTKITRALDPPKDERGNLILNLPADSDHYAHLCMAVAAGGCSDVDNNNAKEYTHIAPANIKKVTVKFED
jgi:hypothetical protein